ncbi:MAG TPA: hypothetical protein VK453_13925 [Micromonosporaceae bacterium]|nr:hypothetical protein [Micromonosporaceae bacterium]
MTSCTCRSCRKGKSATATAVRATRRTATTASRTPRTAPAPTTITTPAPTAPTPPSASGAPDRAQVDQMAAALPADRSGWDGQPLNAKDKRFYALRDSGYSGPIDQDGYPDTTSDSAAILRRMAHDRGESTNW